MNARVLVSLYLIIGLAPLKHKDGRRRPDLPHRCLDRTIRGRSTLARCSGQTGIRRREDRHTRFALPDGNFDQLPRLAQELVNEKVDMILTISTPPAVAAKHATASIPIVTMSADPIGAGLIENLARPGSNVTGLYLPLADLARSESSC